ncbi:MAG: ferredoxin [Dehalococcoidia bacterium]|nr:ferredoxin [Dehalococcoidia bacterium]
MPSMFIRVEVDPQAAADAELAKKLVEVCPVNIFDLDADGKAVVVTDNEDECVLCDLCIQAAPEGRIKVHKLYSGETLER